MKTFQQFLENQDIKQKLFLLTEETYNSDETALSFVLSIINKNNIKWKNGINIDTEQPVQKAFFPITQKQASFINSLLKTERRQLVWLDDVTSAELPTGENSKGLVLIRRIYN